MAQEPNDKKKSKRDIDDAAEFGDGAVDEPSSQQQPDPPNDEPPQSADDDARGGDVPRTPMPSTESSASEFEPVDPTEASKTVLLDTDNQGRDKIGPSIELAGPVSLDDEGIPDDGDEGTVEIAADSKDEPSNSIDGTVEFQPPVKQDEAGTVDLDGNAGPPDISEAVDGTIDATVDIVPGNSDGTMDSDVDMTLDGLDGGKAEKTIAADATVNINPGGSKTIQGGKTIADGADDRLLVDWSSIDRTQHNQSQTIRGVEREDGSRRTSLVIQARSLSQSASEGGNVADYQLLEQLGKGGMGMVYAARQASIDRKVAVKKMLPRVANQPAQREKFLAEAVVTGELDHPNIVPIYDLGTDSKGALFYSMKCVEGTPWSDVIYKKRLAENLEILVKAADAIAFAHSRGVVHRDLKPENIMLGDYGEVLVMDWGLAMPANSSSKRSLGGTPAYMAPEMALGPSSRISAASDIYLFGAMLFEMLAKRPPHTGESVMDCLQSAARNEIVSVRVTGELMDIAMKAMSADPEDRHASMLEFQEALRDYQDHSESIALVHRADGRLAEAVKTTEYQDFAQALFGYEESLQLWEGNDEARFGIVKARLAYAEAALDKGDFDLGLSLLDEESEEHADLRSRLLAARVERDSRQRRLQRSRKMIVGLVVLLLVAISIGLFFVNQQKNRAEQNAIIAKKNEVAANNSAAEANKQKNRADQKAHEADQNAQTARENAETARENAETAEMRRVEAEKATKLAEKREGEAKAAEMLAEKRRIEAVDAQERERREAYVARIGLAAAKIDENSFAQARTILNACSKDLRSWEWGRLNRLANQSLSTIESDSPLEAIAFSKKTNRLAVGGWKGRCQILTYDPATGELALERSLDIPAGFINDLVFSADGTRLITAGSQSAGFATVWNVQTGEKMASLDGHADSITGIAISSDGQRILTCSLDHSVKMWDAQSYELLRTFVGHTWWVWDVAFLPDGTSAVSAGQDGSVIVWNLETGTRKSFQEHRRPVYAVAVDATGRVASGDSDGRVLLWQPTDVGQAETGSRFTSAGANGTPTMELDGHAAAVRSLSFSSSSPEASIVVNRLVSAADDNTLRVFDLQGRPRLWKEIRGHGGRVRACVVLEQGGQILSASHDHTVKVWNLDGYQEQRVFQRLTGHDGAVLAATFAPNDGVFSASQDRTVAGWATKTGKLERQLREGHSFLASNAEIYANGTRLVTAAGDRTVRGWEIATGGQLFELPETGIGAVAAVSPDESWLVTGGPDHTLQIWELDKVLKQTVPTRVLAGHKGDVTAIDFSADGRWIVTGDDRGLVLVWDWENKSLVSKAAAHTSRINAIEVISLDQFAVASNDRTAAIWSLPAADEIAVFPHTSPVSDLAWHEPRSELTTISEKGVIRIFKIGSREPVVTSGSLSDTLSSVAVSPDGNSIAIVDYEQNSVSVLDRNDLEGDPLQVLHVAERGGAAWSAQFLGNQRIVTVGGDDARVWDVASGEISMTLGPQGVVSSVDVSPDGKFLVSANWERTAKVWDLATNKAVQTLGYEHAGDLGPHEGVIYAAKFTVDGKHVATAGRDGTIRLWDRANGQVVRVIKAHQSPIWAIDLSSDGNWIASGGGDGRFAIWNIADGKVVAEQAAHEDGVRAVVFSTDGIRLATGGGDGYAHVWKIENGTVLRIADVEGHSAPVVGVDFHPSEDRLVTGGEDGIAKIWRIGGLNAPVDGELEEVQELLSLTGHRAGVTSVTFSRDGLSVLTSSRDGQLILWQATDWKTP